MNVRHLRLQIDEIIKVGKVDPEIAHSQEDDLKEGIIGEYAPEEIVNEMRRLAAADFPRWAG